jgi:hypothetical protein
MLRKLLLLDGNDIESLIEENRARGFTGRAK